jgi:hypothetical protein
LIEDFSVGLDVAVFEQRLLIFLVRAWKVAFAKAQSLGWLH